MRNLRPFGDDDAFETAFYVENDRRKFAQRRLFLFLAVQTYALFGILDPLMGGSTVSTLIAIRIVTVIVMSGIWGLFVTATDHRTREGCILAFAMVAVTSTLTMIVCARGPAADYYAFALGVIQIFGASLVVPQFRTVAIVCIAGYTAFWCTVPFGQTSLDSLYSNAFMLTVTTVSVAIGSYAREGLERDQLRKERQLGEARDEALRRSREAVEANRAKSHMMANVSHELRTPMNAIIGFSEAMKEQLFGEIRPARYREYAEDIHRSGRLLLSNIDDLLDMARIESGKLGWDESAFPVVEAMETAVKSSRAAMPEGIGIGWYDESGGALVRADFNRLSQAVINLLNNAGKFSEPGDTVALTFLREDDGWSLRIADEGCGIPPEDLHRIREPFAQVGADSYSATRGGLGLGLAITCEIVRRLDGEIGIESAVGRGTTVTIRLPDSRIEEADAGRRRA